MLSKENFNFAEVGLLNKQRKESNNTGISINVKTGLIMFPAAYVREKKLERQYLKFYVDITKNAIGWKLSRESKEYLSTLRDYRKLKRNSSGGHILSIKKVLNQFNFKKQNIKFSRLDIKTYKTATGNMYYVELIKHTEV